MSNWNLPNEIRPGLYLGGLPSLQHIAELDINHVLTVLNDASDYTAVSKYTDHLKVLRINAEDVEGYNLLEFLPISLGFIQEALAVGGKCLVHCAAGVSRSATVVAAYLMSVEGLTAADAVKEVGKRRPQICPNQGFVHQLKLFEKMGTKVDTNHEAYKYFVAAAAGRQWDGADTESEVSSSPAQAVEAPSEEQGTAYRCRKCRHRLASSADEVSPEARFAQEQYGFMARGRSSWMGPDEDAVPDGGGSLFVEPLPWMQSEIGGPVRGKLYCPGCKSRLGSFNWAGVQDTDGAWVVPAFQLHLSRLDAERPLSAESLNIRRPLVGPAATHPGAAPGESIAASARASSDGEVIAEVAAIEKVRPAVAAANGVPLSSETVLSGGVGSSREAETGAAADQPLAVLETYEANGRAVAPAPAATPRGFTHIIFDCDGVLVDSEPTSCEMLRRAILQVTGLDIPHRYPQDFYPVFGTSPRSTVEYYKGLLKRDDWDVDDVLARVRAVEPVIYKELTAARPLRAFPGVAEMIAAARSRGLGVGVASSGDPEKISHNLGSTGLLDLLDPSYIVSAKTVARGKPAPDVYLEAMRRLKCDESSRVLVIEDAVHGLVAAKAAGAYAVGITNTLPRDHLQPHADRVISSLAELDLDELMK